MPKDTDELRPDAAQRVAMQIRFDEYTYAKGRVLAAIYGESFNSVIIRSLRNEIRRYEDKHGELPRQVDPGD